MAGSLKGYSLKVSHCMCMRMSQGTVHSRMVHSRMSQSYGPCQECLMYENVTCMIHKMGGAMSCLVMSMSRMFHGMVHFIKSKNIP